MEVTEVQVEALSDQVWMSMRDRWQDIHRIANNGPDGSDVDDSLILMVFNLVAGELGLREHKRKEME